MKHNSIAASNPKVTSESSADAWILPNLILFLSLFSLDPIEILWSNLHLHVCWLFIACLVAFETNRSLKVFLLQWLFVAIKKKLRVTRRYRNGWIINRFSFLYILWCCFCFFRFSLFFSLGLNRSNIEFNIASHQAHDRIRIAIQTIEK